MKRLSLILLLVLSGLGSALAQDRVSSSFGLSPGDSLAVEQMKARMAEIRKRRPTVALVLSGGGAKGAATVGAMQYIDQYKLPIDLVVGTSVGGLLGGFYSLGYSTGYLDTLIHTLDWDLALSDRVDRSYLPYSKIRYKNRFQLSLPFYYRSDDFKSYISGDLPFASATDRTIHLGYEGKGSLNRVISQNLLGSLPSGLVYGQNVNHIIASRTVAYSDSTSFWDFPIPFACVATDIASAKAKIWHDGSINLALRSTMSIPGLFAPVRTKGMILVDGGMRNNFPVDIARELGADIIIGIDLSTPVMKAEEITNLADIAWRGMDMLSNDSFERNIKDVDVRIHPNLDEYNLMSFNKVAMDTMQRRGYECAKEAATQLKAVRASVGSDTLRIERPRAHDIGLENVVIGNIEFVGISARDADYLLSKMYVRPNSITNRRLIEEDIATIFGKGSYDFVNYELRGTDEPYTLRILCKRGPMHQLGVGMRVDSEELISVLLNIGLNTNAMRGHALDMTARISGNPYLDLHYTYDAPKIPTINLRANLRWTDRNNFLSGTNLFNVSYLKAHQEMYLSNMQWSRFDVKAGIQNDYYRIVKILASEVIGDYDPTNLSQDYPGLFVEGRVETQDNDYFPTQGISAGIRYDLITRMVEGWASKPPLFGILAMDGQMPVSIGRFTLIPQGSLRFIFGDDIPLVFANIIGGDMRGRYAEQQIPFIGIDNAAFRRNYLALARLDARLRLGKNHYITAMGNVSYDFFTFQQFQYGEPIYGGGLGYAYNTILGPFKFDVHWSSLTKTVGVYLSAGLNF
ncbi:MAG: patatin-like phospholipase family protein [Bacteroidales bacterium]|nr:patatin-like phospholipase family protein [Bacteroidales bacterium]